MIKYVAALTLAMGLVPVAASAADDGTNIKPSTQSSGPGVKGDVGGKNGPAAKPNDSKMGNANSGSSTGSSGTSTQPSQDSTGVHGATGNKNGPAAK